MAVRNSWTIFEWPEIWYTMDGVQFMSNYMERPRSVHLARKFYRWDLVNNCENPNLLEIRSSKPVAKLLEF